MATVPLDNTTDTPAPEKVESKYQYPGIPTTCDGAEAVVWVVTRISQGCGAFPITSSTTMGSGFNQAVMNGVPNLWGDQLVFVEPESEHSSASFCEGFAAAGGRVTNFTSGQGLVLMKEVLYTIAGKRLPAVFNIGARALTSHSLNVHAGHDDIMSVSDCGWGVLFARNAQEAGDLCLICRRAAETSLTPFLNVQDGFLTTHTVESVRLIEPEFMKDYIGKPQDKLCNLMDPGNPIMSGVVQNQDSYMKGKIAQRWYYDRIEEALQDAFEEFERHTGRCYDFMNDFNERIIRGYEDGSGPGRLPADLTVARSVIPAGTATLRDFSYVAPEIPAYIRENCTGCMDCVIECPDTAILGKVLSESELDQKLAAVENEEDQALFESQWARTRKYFDGPKKKGKEGGQFAIVIDPSKCKGCAECVTVCDDLALEMIPKSEPVMDDIRKSHRFFKEVGPTNEDYINDNLLIDMMLKEQTHIYVGGAGSCAGCGEGTALRMLCAATGAKYGDQWGIVAATGCNTVYTSTYPYNPYLVPWTNSLFENAPADSMGVRRRWDQKGWDDKPLWCIGGDGAMFDIGFQSLSRLLASGMNIKVFVLDTQVYSNTGGQASTSTYSGQNTKMSIHGKVYGGKQERRKEIAQIAIMHPRTFVAQTTCAHTNHFYKAVLGALEFDGPAVVNCYTTCQPEHGVADNMATDQARLAVDTRAFPLLIYDPRKGDTIRKRLSLQGNPATKEDWWTNPKTGVVVDFIDFCRSEGRFAKHFDKEGNASETLFRAKQDRLENWHQLQELAGLIG